MKETKYKILLDYGTYEGMKWHDDKEYDTVAEAVKEAMATKYSFPFLIVRVIDWKAVEQ